MSFCCQKPEKLEDNVEAMKRKLASCTSLIQLREALDRANKNKTKLTQVADGPKPVINDKMNQREVWHFS